MVRSDGATHPAFESSVTYILTLSEEPKGGTAKFTAANLTVAQATIASVNFVGTLQMGIGDKRATEAAY